MRIKAKINQMGAVTGGISASTGNQWKKMPLILEWQEGEEGHKRLEKLSATAFSSVVEQIEAQGIQAGQEVEVDLHFSLGTWMRNGQVTNDININAILPC